MAFSYMAQRTISDNTKAAALRIKRRLSKIRIVLEAHDALLFSIPEERAEEWGSIIKIEMERPIDFSQCSIPRRNLVVPCELEIGKNYQELSKFKSELFEPLEVIKTHSEDGWVSL